MLLNLLSFVVQYVGGEAMKKRCWIIVFENLAALKQKRKTGTGHVQITLQVV